MKILLEGVPEMGGQGGKRLRTPLDRLSWFGMLAAKTGADWNFFFFTKTCSRISHHLTDNAALPPDYIFLSNRLANMFYILMVYMCRMHGCNIGQIFKVFFFLVPVESVILTLLHPFLLLSAAFNSQETNCFCNQRGAG